MDMITILLSSVGALTLGLYIGKLYFSNRANMEIASLQEKNTGINQQLSELKSQYTQLVSEKENLMMQLVKVEADFNNLHVKNAEQNLELTKIQERFTKEFENLANKILEEKTTKFTEQNKENIKGLLTPLQEKIQLFEKKVDDTHLESTKQNSALYQQIKGLKEIHEQMSRETLNLTRALKGDSKMQGNWGELILEKVLEKSGLEKDREYYVQKSFEQADGTKSFPDVVINLPDGKKMIVDSKVSLTAYERFVNEENEDMKANFLKEHTQSILRHVEQLSAKNYQDLYQMESPDFVFMFVPIETAFSVAINVEANIYHKAYEKNIVIVTPSTLLATLKVIDSMWTNQKQQENALEIARQAGALYDKFVGFMEDLVQIGKRIDDSKAEYGNAMNKLFEGNGNIINRIDNLKKMGARAKKAIPDAVMKRADRTNELN